MFNAKWLNSLLLFFGYHNQMICFSTFIFDKFRTVSSPSTFLTPLFMWPGLVPLETTSVHPVANAGTSLSMAQNVQLLYPWTALCPCGKAILKTPTASAILRGTVTKFTKERCAWDSGLVIVEVDHLVTPTRAGNLCPGSSLKKFPMLSPKCRDKHPFLPILSNPVY